MLLITGIMASWRHHTDEQSEKVQLRTVARVMKNSFLDDPMNAAQLKGITDPERLLGAHAMVQASHAAQNGSLYLLGNDPRAFMIGYDSEFSPWISEKLLMLKTITETILKLGLCDFRILTKNAIKHGNAVNLTWYKQHNTGRHYRIKIIAIDTMLRGTGAFRRLITPALDYADQERIPTILETHNQKNVGLYEHFGFELVRTITSAETHISQYCMIRQPQRRR